MSDPAREATEEERGFLPAYGTASIVLAVFAIVFSKVGSLVINSAREVSESPAEGATTIQGVALVVLNLVALMIVLALAFGVLSLFGWGKREGTSRPLLGVLGVLLAGFMGWVTLSSLQLARQAAGNDSTRPVASDEHGIEITWPGGFWLILKEQELKQVNPAAVAGAVNQFREDEPTLLGLVFVEEVETREFSGLSPDDWVNILLQTSQSENPTIEIAEPTDFRGRDATLVQFTTDAPDGSRIRARIIVFLDDTRIIRLFCGGPLEHADLEGTACQPFFDSVKLK